jgi:hypothetical protein
MPKPEPDIARCSIQVRDTAAPFWQREIYVRNVTGYAMPDTSIDDIVIGFALSIRMAGQEGTLARSPVAMV